MANRENGNPLSQSKAHLDHDVWILVGGVEHCNIGTDDVARNLN